MAPDSKGARSKIARDRNGSANNASVKNKAVEANRAVAANRAAVDNRAVAAKRAAASRADDKTGSFEPTSGGR